MAVYQLKYKQFIPACIEEVWAFFSHPLNLTRITPPALNLRFTNELCSDEIYPGQVITYRVKPLYGIPLFWMTEITQVNRYRYFVDEQRRGPYALWHHQHHFHEMPGGVQMTDLVHYKVPFGLIGRVTNHLYIRKELEKIFSYRYHQIENYFQFGQYTHSPQTNMNK